MRAAWGEDSCDPVDLPWSTDNPAKGQCGVTALVLNDLLGGDLMSAPVFFPDGTQQGWHTWNVFGDGVEVDLTLEQFRAGEVVEPPERIVRAPGPPTRDPHRYEALRARVLTALGIDPTEAMLGHHDARTGPGQPPSTNGGHSPGSGS